MLMIRTGKKKWNPVAEQASFQFPDMCTMLLQYQLHLSLGTIKNQWYCNKNTEAHFTCRQLDLGFFLSWGQCDQQRKKLLNYLMYTGRLKSQEHVSPTEWIMCCSPTNWRHVASHTYCHCYWLEEKFEVWLHKMPFA